MGSKVQFYQRLHQWFGSLLNKKSMTEELCTRYGLEGHWLIATPVHWQATHNDAMIVSCGESLNLSESQGRALFQEFSNFVHGDNIKTHYHDACTWLIQADGKPDIISVSPHDIMHKSITPYLKSLDKTLFWQRLITEIQMLFSEARHQQASVNGVWIWSDAHLPKCAWFSRLFTSKRAS